ncbi:hypothetical protein JCM11641_003935 [Rhodosporidiobolus odoratus]
MLVRLSQQDAGLADLGLVLGYVFALPATSDNSLSYTSPLLDRFEAAVCRVVSKWKLLAGRVVKLEKENTWAVDLDAPTKQSSALTRSRIAKPYHKAVGAAGPLPVLTSSSTPSFHPASTLSHFRHSSTPNSLAKLAATAHPILSCHSTVFDDAVAIGLNIPHGVFDAIGTGILVQAINAELRGQDWAMPPPHEANILSAAVQKLLREPQQTEELPPVLPGFYEASFGGVVRFAVSAAYEKWWHKCSVRYLFLPQDTVDKLVNKVKAEVKEATGGKEYVSTGDVLTAWVLKVRYFSSSDLCSLTHATPQSAHAGETSGTMACSAVFQTRDLFRSFLPSDLVSSLNTSNYSHNCVSDYAFPSSPIPLSTLSTTSLSALALLHRRTLTQIKTPAYLRAQTAASQKATKQGTQPLIPKRDWPEPLHSLPFFFGPMEPTHTHRWVETNQMMADLAELSVPDPANEGKDLPLLAFHEMLAAPLDLDQVFAFQKRKGFGVWFVANLRESRWRSMQMAIDAL